MSIWSDIGSVLVGGLPAILDDTTAGTDEQTGASKTEKVPPSGTASAAISLDPQLLIYAGVAVGAILIIMFAFRK